MKNEYIYRGIKYTFYQYDESNDNLEDNNIVIDENPATIAVSIRQILIEKNSMRLSVTINNPNLIGYWSYSLDNSRLYKVYNRNSINVSGLYKKKYK